MTLMQIHQFHSGTAQGDAITNQMLYLQHFFQGKGYASEIYAEYIPPELKKRIKNICKYSGSSENVLLVHHSMGMGAFDKILSLPDRKILVYHNITPEKYFTDAGAKDCIREGVRQLREYRNVMESFVSDSNYNRKNMIRLGYDTAIDVIPIQISLARFDIVQEDATLMQKLHKGVNILFVGRVVRNKCQQDVLRAFAVYHHFYEPDSRLFFVGDVSDKIYADEILREASDLGLQKDIFFTGKVSEEQLKTYYLAADIFLCMSEHEGFCVPLLEAMKLGVPVIAYRSSAISETMRKAGIIVNCKRYSFIGALMDEIIQDRALYQAIVKSQKKRIDICEKINTGEMFLSVIENSCKSKRKLHIQLQGPFETNYSLALVNRKLAETLDQKDIADVSIYCTEGPGDYEPDLKNLSDKVHAKSLWEKSKNVEYPDITIRNMYPPRAKDVNGSLNFYYWGWEESIIPEKYIHDFNQYLSGIGTFSQYVTNKLIECGIKIPVKTIGVGVELCANFADISPYPLRTRKRIRFLHISSAFPRKGVDVLLQAYFEAFNGNDDVCLVLKTFPNPHNEVEAIILRLNQQYDNPPEVEWINDDLSREKICSLYKAVNCYVSVARGEGFGLPVAEAMLARLPVIVSANSGMADFCDSETAFLVDYYLLPAQTHLSEKCGDNVSLWYEPDIASVIQRLKEFAIGGNEEEIKKKTEIAYQQIYRQFSWSAVSERWREFITEVQQFQYIPSVAMVTTWNSKCGIAEYARMAIEASDRMVDYQVFPNYGVNLIRSDEEFVRERLWKSVDDNNIDELLQTLEEANCEIVHFQFNFGFFDLSVFGDAIIRLSKIKKVIVEFHATQDTVVNLRKISLSKIAPQLNMCSAIVVHQDEDNRRLQSFGVNPTLLHTIPLGVIVRPESSVVVSKQEMKINASLVIGSYGFLLPHKGVYQMIMALPNIIKHYPDALYLPICALYDMVESREYYQLCKETAKKLHVDGHVRFITDFLANEESVKYLQCCDLISMAYSPTKESASAAARFALSVERPLLTTKQLIFEEFRDVSYQIVNNEPEQLTTAVLQIVDNAFSEQRNEYIRKGKEYVFNHSWYMTAQKFYRLYRNVLE